MEIREISRRRDLWARLNTPEYMKLSRNMLLSDDYPRLFTLILSGGLSLGFTLRLLLEHQSSSGLSAVTIAVTGLLVNMYQRYQYKTTVARFQQIDAKLGIPPMP